MLLVSNPIGGLSWKTPVRVATAADLPASTPSGAGRGKTLAANAAGALAVDGVVLAAGNRILVKDYGGAASSPHDGVYVVLDPGAAGRPWILVRAVDLDGAGSATEAVSGAAVISTEGAVNAGREWHLSTVDPIVIDTTPLLFEPLAGGSGGSPTGGAGGQLGGTYPNPDVRGLRETGGPTQLAIGAVADGQALVRSGVSVAGEAKRPVFAAGTQTASSGTVVFSNSNGVSFGMSAGTVTASVVPGAGAPLVSAGTTSNSLSQIVFSNSNGLSFGLNGSTITGSYTVPSVPAQTVQTQGVVAPSAGTQTATSGTVVFANSNGLTFGMSGSSQITGSYTVPSTAGLLSAINASAGTTSNNLSAVVFSNSNNVSFGLSGSTVTATVTVPAQTVQSIGVYGLGNTTGQSSSTVDARSLSVVGDGIVSVGLSAGSLRVSASQSAQTQNIVVPSAGTQTANSGTVVFSNSNGISFGMSGSSRITASYTVPSTAGLISAINASAGTTSNNLSALTFSNSNGVSFGLNGSTLTASVATSLTAINASAGTTSNNLSAVVFSNSNGVSFGLNGSTVTGSVAAQSAQTIGGYAAGNTAGQSSSSTLDARSLSVSGAGIVSVGYSAGMLVVSAPPPGAGTLNVSAGTTSNNATQLVFSNSNGVSFGLNASTVTASVATSLTAINVSAGTTSNNLSAVVFSNSNGVSFGLNGSTVTGSVPAQSVQSVGLYGVGNTTQNSSTTVDARSVSFNGLGIVTVGFSNGSVQVSASQSAQTVGGYAAGNTTGQSSSSTVDARSLSISGAGVVSVGYSAGVLVVSAPPQGAGNVNVSAGTTSNAVTQVVFSNSNGLSFGLNGSTVTGSYTVPTQTNQSVGLYGLANTTGQSSSTTADARSLSFSALGAASVGYSAGAVVVSVPNVVAQTAQTVGLYGVGNTTQNSSTTLDARSISLNGLGDITVGYSNGSVQISGSQTAQTQNVVVPSAGTQTATSGTVVFSNSNGISFGMSGSSRITASYTVPSTAGLLSAVNVSAGTTSNNLSAFVFSNSNNVSFGLNGSTVTATVTVPAQTVQTAGLYGLGNTTGQSSSTTADARSLSFSALGAASVGYSAGAVVVSVPNVVAQTVQTQNVVVPTAGTQTATSGTLAFANSNGISFGMSGSSQITASYTVPVQTVQTVGFYGIGNTTGQSSSSTVDARTVSVSGAGGVSVGYSGGVLVVSGATGGAGGSPNFSAGTTSNNLATVVFSNSNGVSFGLNGSTITASASVQTEGWYAAGNTTGQSSSTTINPLSVSLVGGGAASVGFSNGSVQVSAPAVSSLVGAGGVFLSTNGSTVSISGPSIYNFEPKPFSNSSGLAHGAGSWYIQPFTLPANMPGGRINMYVSGPATASMLQATNGTSFVSNTTGSRSVSFSYAKTLALYSLGAGTNSTRLESFWSNTFSLGIAQSVSVATGGATSISVTNAVTLSYVASIGSNGAYTTSSSAVSTSASVGASSMNTTAVSGATAAFSALLSGSFVMPVGLNTTLTPGNYWLGQAQSVNSTTAGTTVNAASVWSAISQYGMSGSSAFSNFRVWGATVATSGSQFNPGMGVLNATASVPPATIAFTDIRTMASAYEQYFNIINSSV